MVQFNMNPSRTKIKQVSESSPTWASGGDYNTPKQGANAMKPEAIVTSGGGSGGDWARGGGDSNVGKQKVGHCKPL